MKRQTLFYTGLFVVLGLLLAACGSAGSVGPAGPQGETGPAGPAGEAALAEDLSCTGCHDSTTLIAGKAAAWSTSLHGTGESFMRGTSASCAGCHSGGGFSARIAAGLNPDELEAGDPNPTRQDCRTCHEIHTTYTTADFALETTDPVELFTFAGQTFDGGLGNLCANCHQPRRAFPEAVDGMVEIVERFNTHYGVESAMLLGIAGAGEVVGKPSSHATQVEDTCVTCHMGEGRVHTFAPSVATCQGCHDGAENFDINGVQTQVQDLLDELESLLMARGLLTEGEEGPVPVLSTVMEPYAAALWNWAYIANEDGSLGVHNPTYTIALLEYSIEALK